MGWLGILWVMLLGSGCDRWGSGSQNEAHEAITLGKQSPHAGQTNRAIQSFERALHANPANSPGSHGHRGPVPGNRGTTRAPPTTTIGAAASLGRAGREAGSHSPACWSSANCGSR